MGYENPDPSREVAPRTEAAEAYMKQLEDSLQIDKASLKAAHQERDELVAARDAAKVALEEAEAAFISARATVAELRECITVLCLLCFFVVESSYNDDFICLFSRLETRSHRTTAGRLSRFLYVYCLLYRCQCTVARKMDNDIYNAEIMSCGGTIS